MAWAKPTSITSWSFSRLKVYEQCPFKARQLFIEKFKEPVVKDGPLDRGDRIHKAAEAYVRGVLPRLPPELKEAGKLLKTLRARFARRDGVEVEQTWAFRKDWSVTRWDDWNGCVLRVKVDVAYDEDPLTVAIVDWKTGKYSPQYNLEEYVDQVDLYATAALVIHAGRGPGIRVVPRLVFTDHGIVHPPPGEEKVYTPADLPELKKAWDKRPRAMMNDRKFAPKPNRFCGNCHFRRDNVAAAATGGGTCVF